MQRFHESWRKNDEGQVFMRLTFIGSASAFATMPGNFSSNMLFEIADPETGATRRLLFDCGSDVR